MMQRLEARAVTDPTRADEQCFDLVVIGGGITGAGVALDAATRGLDTVLLERDDLASGTSSRSSKLVHGGLRYLQNGDIRLVYQALRERQRLMRNAPHLVTVLPFVLPILTRDGVISAKIARALGSALWMYDLTGGWRIGRRHRRLDAAAVLDHVPTLDPDRVAGGYLYFDAATDDARLTMTVARTAADHGAIVVNRCAVVDLGPPPPSDGALGAIPGRAVRAGKPVPGRLVTVEADGRRFQIAARTIVSATGVWADAISRMDDPHVGEQIRPARGVHLTVPWQLIGNDIAVVIPVPGDRRSLFVIPWGPLGDGRYRYAYIGTTDTDHDGPLDDPPCSGDDIEYVLRAANAAFRAGGGTPISIDDVTGVWSGLRPLVRDASSARTADLSRTHRVSISTGGLITIAGGKLTTYREMAEDTVDTVMKQLRRRKRSTTRRLRLHGACAPPVATDPDHHLISRYGTDAALVRELMQADPTLAEPLVDGLEYYRAEAVYAVRYEMATDLVDIAVRRTLAHYRDRSATEAAAPAIAELLAGELGWDRAETERQLAEYRSLCEAERRAAVVVS